MTYVNFIRDRIEQIGPGIPIYTDGLSEKLARYYSLEPKGASAATSVAMKRIMDAKLISDLRIYQKGIYYRTVITPFGESGIDRERLIADKYLLPDKGYETGLLLLYRMGLTTQLPREHVIATNVAKDCVRKDKKLGVSIRPPKAKVNAENMTYLQILDALEIIDKAPIDVEQPYELIANRIKELELDYGKLLFFANHYYHKNTILQLARTAGEGGY